MKLRNSHPASSQSPKTRVIGCAICSLLFLLSGSADAQQPPRIVRLGYLSSSRPTSDTERSEGIKLALGQLGYREGENIVYHFRYAEERLDRLPQLAAELVRLHVDVIIAAGGGPVIQAPINATQTIPIIMAGQGADPVAAGFVKSLSKPGGNVTGMTNLLVQLGDKRLELLKEAVPKITRVAVPYVPENATHSLELKEVQSAARALGITVQTFEIRHRHDFDKAFTSIDKYHPDGLQLLGGPVIRESQKRIIDFALNKRLPSVFTSVEAVKGGGLLYYGADLSETYRRVAFYIDKILKGTKPADLPVEQPTKFELVINLKTAKEIGLTIPPNVLARADRVIK
ncbi:MAG TPA: ABC transporter substrate-binding protein [Candidatus Binatia bacterium]|nr:ABC transporter substrate-binding protein [Candidatus Binatia bacterium]